MKPKMHWRKKQHQKEKKKKYNILHDKTTEYIGGLFLFSMTNKINIAVLGNGFMGKKHREAISLSQNFSLTAIMDSSCEESHDEKCILTSFEHFLESDTNTDAVVIATPNYLHFQQAKMLLLHGYHVIIEKPFCMNPSEALELEKLEEKTGKNIFTIMQNRHSSVSLWLKEMIGSGRLGNIYMVQTNCFWNRNENYYLPKSWKGTKEMDGGTLYTQFTHYADLMMWIFGDVKNICSTMKTFRHQQLIEIEDTGMVTFEFEKGGIGSLNFTTAVYEKNLESSMTVIAENGSIKINGQYFNQIEVCNVKDYSFDLKEIKTPDNIQNLMKEYELIQQQLSSGKSISNTTDRKKLIDFLACVYCTY